MTDKAEETAEDPEAEHIASVSKLDERVGRIETAVQTLINSLHGKSEKVTEEGLSARGNVAEEVQAELARRDAKAKADADAAEFTSLKETVAKLAEKPPESPHRRIEEIMGYHG
jgi:hypothetical protein